MIKRSFRALVAALPLLLPWTADAAVEESLSFRLDAIIDAAIADQRIVGTVVLVACDGQVIYARAAGWADRENRRPMTRDAIFRLSSLTKPMVSAAALALVEQGKLELDAPVTRWLPDFQPRLADGRAATITIRQLLTHTAGLAYGFFEKADGPYHLAGVSDGLDAPGLSLEENLRRIASVPLSYEPGAGWGYSVATDVLGAAMAAAGQASLPELTARLVTRPLGMADTGFTATDRNRLTVAYADGAPRPVRMAAHQVVPFGDGAGISFAPDRLFHPGSFPSGGAGLVGTADDYLRFLECLRQGGDGVLRPATVAAMTSIRTGDLPVALPGPGWGWGLGMPVLRDAAAANMTLSEGSYAWGGVYGHSWFVDPNRRISVVILTNTAIEGMNGRFPVALQEAITAAIPASGPSGSRP